MTPTASYIAQFLGNPSGGQSKGFTYAGTFELLVHWDIGKLLPVGGLSLVVGTGWSTGRSLSADEIGNIFAVQSAFTAVDGGSKHLTLGPLYLHQRLLDDTVDARGRTARARRDLRHDAGAEQLRQRRHQHDARVAGDGHPELRRLPARGCSGERRPSTA